MHLRCIHLSQENQTLRKGLQKAGFTDAVVAHREVRSRSSGLASIAPIPSTKTNKALIKSFTKADAAVHGPEKQNARLDEVLNALSVKQLDHHCKIVEFFFESKKKSFYQTLKKKAKEKLVGEHSLRTPADVA